MAEAALNLVAYMDVSGCGKNGVGRSGTVQGWRRMKLNPPRSLRHWSSFARTLTINFLWILIILQGLFFTW